MTLDTTQPSRELDAAVARALGYDVRQVDFPVFTRGRDWVASNDYHVLRADGGIDEVPNYSKPIWLEDRAALLDCVLWLARRACLIELFNKHWLVVDVEADEGEQTIVRVSGTDDAAFALAVCRAVVMIGAKG